MTNQATGPRWVMISGRQGAVRVDLEHPRDLSLRIGFGEDAERVDAFHLPSPVRTPVVSGGFVGDVAQGGSCQCHTLQLTPHGNGTHTECVGHLVQDPVSVIDCLHAPLLQALLVTVTPSRLDDVGDDVAGNHGPDDRVVDADALNQACLRVRACCPPGFCPDALIVRTTGMTGFDRRRARYSGCNPPYFTLDAARLVVEQSFLHLLIDLPSLDREDDGGLLGAHRVFFGLAPGEKKLSSPPSRRTLTELICVDDDVADGAYALSLQLPPIAGDAVPSRPLVYPLQSADAMKEERE